MSLSCTLHEAFRWLYEALVQNLSACWQSQWAEFTAWYILSDYYEAALSNDLWRGTVLLITSEVNWLIYNEYKLISAII